MGHGKKFKPTDLKFTTILQTPTNLIFQLQQIKNKSNLSI